MNYSHKYFSTGLYCLLIILAATAGIISRIPENFEDYFILKYAGDTLWAYVLYFLLRIVIPGIKPINTATLALVISTIVEASQLLQYDFLISLRSTIIGGYILGYGWHVSDLFCYASGIILAFSIDKLYLVRIRKPPFF